MTTTTPEGSDASFDSRATEILMQTGAIQLNGHFVYRSGEHGSTYINKDAFYPDVEMTWELCRYLGDMSAHLEPDVVVGPEKGGIILSTHTARSLGPTLGRPVLSVFAEKDGNGFMLRRGYEKLVQGKRVLIVEDNLTTGLSVRLVTELIRKHGGEVVGVSAIVNRGGVTADDIGNVPLYTLLDLDMESQPETDCSLCGQSVPVNTEFGHGEDFLDRINTTAWYGSIVNSK